MVKKRFTQKWPSSLSQCDCINGLDEYLSDKAAALHHTPWDSSPIHTAHEGRADGSIGDFRLTFNWVNWEITELSVFNYLELHVGGKHACVFMQTLPKAFRIILRHNAQ